MLHLVTFALSKLFVLLWRCCLRNSTEIVLIRVSTGTMMKVDVSDSYIFLSPGNTEVSLKNSMD